MAMITIAPPAIAGFEALLRGGTNCVLQVRRNSSQLLAVVESQFCLRRIRYNNGKSNNRFELDIDFLKKENNPTSMPEPRRVGAQAQFPLSELGEHEYLIALYNSRYSTALILVPGSLGPCPEARVEEGENERIITFIWP